MRNEFEDYQEKVDLEVDQPDIIELTDKERLDLTEQAMQDLIIKMLGDK